MAELRYWIWLARARVNLMTAHRALEQFGGPKEIFFAEREALETVPGIRPEEVTALAAKQSDHVSDILEQSRALGLRILTYQDAEYPQRLRDIPDPPLTLYVRGRLPVVDDVAAVAIAGTRKASAYGRQAVRKIGGEIARCGGVVVSGLALGIDGAGAEGALDAGGTVIGVLGCGVDQVYPAEHGALFDRVLGTGAIVSEYPPGTRPDGWRFKPRNRIITGLSLALVVADIPGGASGAKNTVGHAVEQGREVYVVPANIDAETSRGSNELIREGFLPVFHGWDVLREYARQYPGLSPGEPEGNPPPKPAGSDAGTGKKSRASAKKEIDKAEKEGYIGLKEELDKLSVEELGVIAAMDGEPRHIDEIIARSGLAAGAVTAALTTLEIAGYIEQFPGKRYRLDFKG